MGGMGINIGLSLGVQLAGRAARGCEPVDQIDGVVEMGTTFEHPADGVIAYTVDALPSPSVIDVRFRSLDTANYWRIRVYSGGVLELNEFVNNDRIQRGSSASGTATVGDRIAVVMDDEVIGVYCNAVKVVEYASAANFKNETSGSFAAASAPGAISDLKTWALDCRGMEGV